MSVLEKLGMHVNYLPYDEERTWPNRGRKKILWPPEHFD
jgi:hypothetical protein